MKIISKSVCTALIAALLLTGCSSAGSSSSSETAAPETTAAETAAAETEASDTVTPETATVRIGALSGPTAFGLVNLMNDNETGSAMNTYEFADLSTDPSVFVPALASGNIDIAAIPSNLASVVYNNTQGKIRLLAINTLGVLNIVERGGEIKSVADLAGKKLYSTGEGATPEYTLRYVLSQNGIDPDSGLEIQWCADTTEALSYISQDENAVAMLPQPFVTVAMSKVEGLRIAVDLNDEWAKLNTGCSIVTGVLVVRTAFAEEHPDLLSTFLDEYEASCAYLSEDPDGACSLIEKYGIVPAAVAAKALPSCSQVCITGADMKDTVGGYYQLLYDSNPQSVGGTIPDDAFYYIP